MPLDKLGATLDRYRLDNDRPNKETSIERLMRQGLDLAGIAYSEQGRIGRYRPDFLLEAHRIVVECDGPHHERPAQQVKDRRRDAAMIAAGYRVLRFSHTRIRSSLPACIDEIKRACS